ncbi:MAG TPA: glycosyltransferase family 39 protein, partial [Thermoanaerobaculia bacterium]|nr:glycosyltransferase family 39 protein [Thermoanaerobaculia bacterium]
MTAASPPRESHDPEASGRTLFALALLAGALLRLVLLGAPDLAGSDEGLWAVSARNVVEGGLGALFGVGRTPLGPPAPVPLLFPWLLQFMVRIFGAEEWAIRLPSVAAGLVGAFVLERIVRRGYGQPAGHLAGAFAALFPPLVAVSRAATVEAVLVTLGLFGVIFGLRALEEGGSADAALSGLSFGLGILAKGPAVLLFVAPLLVALAFRPRIVALGRTRRVLLIMAAAFAAPTAIHLGSVFVFKPANLSVAVASVLGASLEGPSGTWGTELKAIVRTLGLFLPLVGAGVAYLFRALGEREVESGATGVEARLSHDAFWATYMVELVVLVAVNGKFQLGTAPAMPVLAAFSGFGATALFLPNRESARRAESRFP